MPTRTQPVVAWSPTYVANAVAATLQRAADNGLSQAIRELARTLGLSTGTIEEWVSRARTTQTAPVPPGLLACRACDQPMILIQLPTREQEYLCAPACDRAPVPAETIRAAIAVAVLRRAPGLVPTGKAARAADFAPGAMHRVRVGATGTDLSITWRTEPQQVIGPRMAMAQRLHQARQHAETGNPTRAVEILRSGLLHIDPMCDDPALDTATAHVAALLARLTLGAGDPHAALPWAAWAHRSLRRVLRSPAAPEARAALKVLAAAHHRVGDLTAAAHNYSDLTRHHCEAEGPTALPTLAAQATLAVVLYENGHCEQAQQLLARTITTHRRIYRDHPARARMTEALHRMRATCASHHHGLSNPHSR